ncbi:hypothetical protein ACNTMW_19430 [Planosporangium sp. 12N6]|uniref:hypothetical protein n=1 Tax=Planosporangium spinosum TaxID=3402278 RepID=UPI003CEE90A0
MDAGERGVYNDPIPGGLPASVVAIGQVGVQARVTTKGLAVCLALTVTAVVGAGCDPAPTRSTSPAPTTSWPLHAPPGDFTEKYERAKKTVLPADALGTASHPSQSTPETVKEFLVEACNLGRLPSDGHTRGGYRQVWKFDDGRLVDQFAQPYDIQAADVVAEVNSLMRCGSYRVQDRGQAVGANITVVRDVSPPADVPTEGSLFFCEVSSKSRCVAIFSRDDAVTRVEAVATSREQAEQLMRQVAPMVAQRLASAW